ncbi:LacI family DNA-binding transcriptional regulator, partial [bacterium AH-315-I18]|nr:LacI family DNA-binding transcriptional regulator [bacterium AH-315-I18]
MTQINTPNQAVTMQDVANRLGVSHTTISQVLRGVGRISEERQHEIRRVVQEMGYHPHVGAQLLSRKKTGQLGLIISQSLDIALESGFFGPILGNFISACQEEGQSYDIEVVSLDEAQPFEPPRQLTGQLVDGTLIAGGLRPALADWLRTQNRPWVCIDDEAPYSVHSLLDDGVYQAVQHLAALGHRRIAFMGGPMKYRSHRLMRDGFDRAVLDFRLNPSDSGHDWAWQSDDGAFSPAMIRQARDHIQSLLDLP